MQIMNYILYKGVNYLIENRYGYAIDGIKIKKKKILCNLYHFKIVKINRYKKTI